MSRQNRVHVIYTTLHFKIVEHRTVGSDSNCTGNQLFKDEYLLQNCNQKLKPEME